MFDYCSQQRNITIVLSAIETSNFEKFLVLLKDLIDNEECYIVNLYLPNKGGSVRFRKDTNVNLIESTCDRRSTTSCLEPFYDINKFITNLSNEKIEGNESIGQTFVLMVDHTSNVLQPLQKLQDERRWEVIVYWESKVGRNLSSIKMPLHRVIGGSFHNDLALKNLKDVVKEPNFSRYDFYRTIPLKEDFFNGNCLRHIDRLHITVYFLNDLYLPMLLAIIGKENERRKKKNIEPLKVVFYTYHLPRNIIKDNLRDYDKNVKMKTWFEHPLKTGEKDKGVFISVFEEGGSYCGSHEKAIIP